MSLLTEPTKISDVLLYEKGEEFNFVRDAIVMVSGTAAAVVGQLLGKITLAGATQTHAGNTGNGVMTLDVTTPVLAFAAAGVYSVVCTAAATNSGTFRVTDPRGRVLGDVAVAATFADQIKFAIADGSADFIVGDTFLVTVAAGSGKYAKLTPAALDGSQNCAGVLLSATDASAADANGIAVVRGPAILKTGGITYTSGMTTPQKAQALTDLVALGITTRTDYGV